MDLRSFKSRRRSPPSSAISNAEREYPGLGVVEVEEAAGGGPISDIVVRTGWPVHEIRPKR
jgi:hypothetical protein